MHFRTEIFTVGVYSGGHWMQQGIELSSPKSTSVGQAWPLDEKSQQEATETILRRKLN